MHRRELLGAVGTGTVGLTGLLGMGARGAGQDTETTTMRETTTGGEEFDGIESSADLPFATVSVGTRTGVLTPENARPHEIRVWNASDRARTIALRLTRGGETATLDRRVEFPADGYLTLRLLEPGDYALAVAANGDATARTVELSRSQFDCNDSRTAVRVAPDGGVQSVTTTEEACPLAVVERTFTAFQGTCGSADDANVSFGEESVGVSGAIRVPNPCYGARLAEVAVSSADALRVVVAATDPTAGVCVQCVGTVEYAADLGLRDSVPETVEVVHRRDGDSAVVATASRGEETTTDRASS
ncbi:hypothetical protein [Halorussus pelagicus]|uniref:hypothetical protein n=1 Tax=Halorussus pelagicus TaxID=2505977 RepID=UPI000FFB2B95|nr:hypothetical protein [Halorussus pelagicus]